MKILTITLSKIITALLIIGYTPSAYAEAIPQKSQIESSKESIAGTFLKSFMAKEKYITSMSMAFESTVNGIDTSKLPKERVEKLKRGQKRAKELMLKELSWEVIREDMVKLYAEAYSEEELKELTKFYLSPLGQKVIKTDLALLPKANDIIMKKTQELQLTQKIQKIMMEEMMK